MTKDQIYYAQHKNDEAFMESRRKAQQHRRDTDPAYKEYLRRYAKRYYQLHKEHLNQLRKKYPDKTRNERVSRFRKKEALELARAYIVRLLTRSGQYTKEEITPAMIRAKRTHVKKFREKKLLKAKEKPTAK